MARASLQIVDALRATVKSLEFGAQYMWGHMGSCNCGNLAQVVTKRTKAEIHGYAMQGQGDWNEQVNHYCENSNMPIDLVIFDLMSFGFSLDDLKNLEKLSDPEVLARLGDLKNDIQRNNKQHLIAYLSAWANIIEKKLLSQINISTLQQETPKHAELVLQ
jgi:hypothetical protein